MRALIAGTGLIGASLGAGLRGAGWEVVGWDPSPESLQGAAEVGALDHRASDLETGLGGADLVVLAAPIGEVVATLAGLETDALVTDVAGVKVPVVAAGAHLPHFVGGHPMAGRESSGPGAASGAMFRGATWVLTSDGASSDDLARMVAIVESLGAVAVTMSAQEHDAAVAAVSHLPQVVASSLVNLVAGRPAALELAAGGFRDVTRIALSEPVWWADILAENRGEVASLVRALGSDLTRWANWVESGETLSITRELDTARNVRRGLAPPVGEVRVLLEDRPGEIARVGQALAQTGTDVRDLQLRHATRGGGGVLTLSVPPDQVGALGAALEAEGFRLVR